MGAEAFESSSKLEDVQEAFQDCWQRAAYDYGHAGYTGTIAEKDSFVIVDLPEGLTIEEAIDLLESAWSKRDPRLPEAAYDAYDDKWGPAVALKNPEGGWIFCGWASS